MLGLPLESNTLRKLGAWKPGEWHNVEELLAQIMETIYEGHRLFYKANAKKGSQPPPPLKVPRPAHVEEQTAKAKKKRPATSEELARFFGNRSVIVNYTPKEG